MSARIVVWNQRRRIIQIRRIVRGQAVVVRIGILGKGLILIVGIVHI